MQEAILWRPLKEDNVQCNLCPHHCTISNNGLGTCAVRKNVDGRLFALTYGKVIARHVDPIEKKPLYHFMPGTRIYSFATAGCNMRCSFCQNWDISQISKGKDGKVIGEDLSPQALVDEAISNGCKSIAMTYNEPTIFFEFALETCKVAKEAGLSTVFVSNGYITPEAIGIIVPFLDAINIDIKAFTEKYYKEICGARLQPILDSIKLYHTRGVHVEVTTLIVPGENDSVAELKQIAGFLASIDPNIPWHISRFHPDYKMTDKDWTPESTLHKAYKVGKDAGINYIYVGNVPGGKHENTLCPGCGKMLIRRHGYWVSSNLVKDNKCPDCSFRIYGVL